MKRWCVVSTHPVAERMAEGQLGRQGCTTYLPRRMKERRHARRCERVTAPLFPRYLFVELDLGAQRWRAVNGTFGVSYLVAMGERPAPVPSGIVEAIRAREDEHGLVEVPAESPFRRGETVRITGGALSDQTGLFEAMDDRQRIVVLLSMLGRDLRVRVPAATVRAYA